MIYCLSIMQPHAWAIVTGQKTVEYRKWKHVPKVRGWFAVHAGLKIDHEAHLYLGEPEEFNVGCIVGLAFISKAIMHDNVVWIGLTNHAVLPKPIPLKGKLGFFPLESNIVRNIKRQAKKLGVQL
jgi:hypothetical protein